MSNKFAVKWAESDENDLLKIVEYIVLDSPKMHSEYWKNQTKQKDQYVTNFSLKEGSF